MNDLSIREENCQEITILHMQGNLSQKNWLKLESILKNFLKHALPEFILLECSQIQYIEKECMLLLQKTAVLFSDQARELSLCAIPVLIEKNFFAPPLSYYESQEDAMQNFRKSQPKAASVLHLSIVAGPCKGSATLRPGEKEITIGRHSKCNLSIPQDIKSSRFHCKVYEKNGLFVLEDMQSSNGTFYQDKMITLPTELKDGSHFQAGESKIKVSITEDEDANVSSAGSLDFSALPSLEISDKEEPPTEEANIWPTLDSPMSSGMEVGGMETVIGISLTDLLGDALKTDRLKPIKPKQETPSALKIPEEKIFASEKIEAKEEKKFENFLDPESWSLLQQNLPSVLRRRSAKLTSQDIGGYKIIKKKGESSTCLLLQCSIGKEQDKIFLQYSKEPMLVPDILPLHPHILLPKTQGEQEERIYRVFPDPGESLPSLPLAEIKLLEIAILLADVLKILHESGISGFDLASENIFYRKDQLPVFALIPSVVYEDILGEAADFYSYGLLLFHLATGHSLPYTPIGTLDREELQKLINKISAPVWQVICEILKRQENNWDRISNKLEEILFTYLSPNTLSQKAKILDIVKMDNSLLFHFQGEASIRIAWKEDIAQKILQKMLTHAEEKDLAETGQEFYKTFYPVKIQKIFEKDDMSHLVLNLDERLHSLPWEMAHDGKSFLNQKTFIERKVFPDSLCSFAEEKIDSPRIFLISGSRPEELQNRDSLENQLQEEFPWIKIKTAHCLENSYDILQRISQSDIAHIMLPIAYNKESPLDSGWKLDDKKILKLRFLENAQRLPKVLFHHRTTDSELYHGSFISQLYLLQIPYVFGTMRASFSWQAASRLYCNLLKGKRFFEAIQDTKKEFQENSALVFYGCGQKLLGISSRFKG